MGPVAKATSEGPSRWLPRAHLLSTCVMEEEINQALAILADRRGADAPGDFPSDPSAADKPGLYAWWADQSAVDALSHLTRPAPRLLRTAC
jgi:hypothetical protein